MTKFESEVPVLDRVHPIKYRLEQQKEKPDAKTQQYIRHLEETPPRVRLSELTGGAIPSASDLKIIESILVNQKLLPGVLNVLIEYIIFKTDMFFTKSYVEKIASRWTRKRIFTVFEAMDVARNEHRQYQEWLKNAKKNESDSASIPYKDLLDMNNELSRRLDEQQSKHESEMLNLTRKVELLSNKLEKILESQTVK